MKDNVEQIAHTIFSLFEKERVRCYGHSHEYEDFHNHENSHSNKQSYIVAIDGRCGSGKTTLASYLQKQRDCTVIHMDHFFLRPEQRTAGRLQTPGGNVDYERFIEEVMVPLKQGVSFRYCPYDCSRQVLAEPIEIEPKDIVIVEGSYSCHPALWDDYDLRVFLTVDSKRQLERIRRRNGDMAVATFQDKWIPLEEKYFAAYRTEERCDLRFEMQDRKI